jgi:hypothetical protein
MVMDRNLADEEQAVSYKQFETTVRSGTKMKINL